MYFAQEFYLHGWQYFCALAFDFDPGFLFHIYFHGLLRCFPITILPCREDLELTYNEADNDLFSKQVYARGYIRQFKRQAIARLSIEVDYRNSFELTKFSLKNLRLSYYSRTCFTLWATVIKLLERKIIDLRYLGLIQILYG